MRSLWGTIAQAWLASEQQTKGPSQPNRKHRRDQQPQQDPGLKAGIDILKELPHLLHMTFLGVSGDSSYRLWAAMKPEYMTISSEDLTMKFGAVMDGVWTVVGIVDAKSGDSQEALPVNDLIDGVIKAVIGVRSLIGRPQDHLGLTPIAIYTPLLGLAETEAAESASESDSPPTHP